MTGHDGIQWQACNRHAGRRGQASRCAAGTEATVSSSVSRKDSSGFGARPRPRRDVPPTHSSNHTRCIHVNLFLSSPSNVVVDGDEAATGLLLGEAVEGRLEGAAKLVDERVELDVFVV